MITRVAVVVMCSMLLGPAAPLARGAEHLQLNPRLDYTSDSDDGPLFAGTDLGNAELSSTQPTYIIFFERNCYNSKRQARRTVELYAKYKSRVHFVTVDLATAKSDAQQKLERRFFTGFIPHLTILDASGKVLYDRAGEVELSVLIPLLDKALKK